MRISEIDPEMEAGDIFSERSLWGTGPMQELLGVIRNELSAKFGVKWETNRIFMMFCLLEDQINDLHNLFRSKGKG